MKRILIVSTVSRQFYLFEKSNIEVLHSLGYEVHAAANFSDANERLDSLNIIRHPFDIQRSPFSIKNIMAYKQLKKIMKEGKFDAVHCHSPMGGVLARIAAKAVGVPHVFYTAHGFHFYKGAPIKNWCIYYPIEKILSRHTDVLITINQEDFRRAQRSLNAKKVEYIPGIGIETERRSAVEDEVLAKRTELGIDDKSIVLLSVGELNKNKNHKIIISAVARINNPNLYYMICGKGDLEHYLLKLVTDLGLTKHVKLLGYRTDIDEISRVADIFVFPSYREGLPVSMMEAMASGLPVVCSQIRGNTDLIENGKGGFLLEPRDATGFVKYISKVIDEPKLRQTMGEYNKAEIRKFDRTVVMEKMRTLYSEELSGGIRMSTI